MSKLSFRARALDASKPMPIYLAEELPDLPDYSAINRAVPQMPSGMEKEEECEHHLQRAICTGLIIPTPEVCDVQDLEFYERCYPPDYKMPKQHIHMQPLWQEQEAPEYDIDSEDERWLKQQRHPELTELMFEQMMDKLEKSSGQTVVTLNEAKLLLERHDDLVIAVYDYWLNKRLKTQHPLILSVKTESRPGQSSNNPYLAFRRRTEKMQTRKNRKNDESSYEKMLKLRRDLARALSLLELVARREKAKRELLKLTAVIAERRYRAGDYAEPQPRPQYPAVSLATPSFRRDAYAVQHYPPRAPPTPVDQPRPREKRPYKRRKHRHHPAGSALALREPAPNSSSEEDARAEPAAPDDGPFAFRRKPGCYYEMPTTTLCGDPVDPENPNGLFEHEIDVRHRYTLTSLRTPYRRCVGFARLRRARGGRLALDRVATPLDDLWHTLPPPPTRDDTQEEVDLETKVHRTPKEISRDYHASGKYPWRHAFRKHLAANPALWIKTDPDVEDKPVADVKHFNLEDIKLEPMDVQDSVKSDISVRTIDSAVRENLDSVMRKRSWSGCSDADSDDSLHPVEREFEKFIDEVNKKWLHFRPKTPPPSPPYLEQPSDDQFPIAQDTPISIELRSDVPSGALDTFTTSEFTLGGLYGDLLPEQDSGHSLDISGDDLLNADLSLTEAQVESILSETDLKSLADDKKGLTDALEQLVQEVDGKDPFLCPGRSQTRRDSGRPRDAFGSTVVRVTAESEPIYMDKLQVKVERAATPPKKLEAPADTPAPAPPPPPADLPQIKIEKKKKEDTIEEIQLGHGVQLKTVQTKHSPLKKHIITSAHRRASASASASVSASVSASTHDAPQILTVAVSDSLKVRLQNHLLSSQAGGVSSGATVVGLVQNGPFTAVAQTGVGVGVSAAGAVAGGGGGAGRRGAPLVQLAPARPLTLSQPVVVGALPHAAHAHNKLKVLHAHPLTHEQRAQLLHGRAHGITQLPAVVSLATLEAKSGQPTGILKAGGGSVAQLFEIKGGQLGKGAHLVNVVRGAAPAKPPAAPQHARLDLADAKKRQLVATIDSAAKAGAVGVGVGGGGGAGGRVSLALDRRQLVRATLPLRAAQPHLVRHQIQLKQRRPNHPTISIAAPTKTASIPSSVVANLLQKNVSLGAPRLSLPPTSGVQAIAFTAAQLKARQARLLPRAEVSEVRAGAASAGAGAGPGAGGAGAAGGAEPDDDTPNGAVRRRPADTLPMEVT